MIQTKEWVCMQTTFKQLRRIKKSETSFLTYGSSIIRTAGKNRMSRSGLRLDPPESLAEPWSVTRLGRPGTAWVVRYQTAWSTSVA